MAKREDTEASGGSYWFLHWSIIPFSIAFTAFGIPRLFAVSVESCSIVALFLSLTTLVASLIDETAMHGLFFCEGSQSSLPLWARMLNFIVASLLQYSLLQICEAQPGDNITRELMFTFMGLTYMDFILGVCSVFDQRSRGQELYLGFLGAAIGPVIAYVTIVLRVICHFDMSVFRMFATKESLMLLGVPLLHIVAFGPHIVDRAASQCLKGHHMTADADPVRPEVRIQNLMSFRNLVYFGLTALTWHLAPGGRTAVLLERVPALMLESQASLQTPPPSSTMTAFWEAVMRCGFWRCFVAILVIVGVSPLRKAFSQTLEFVSSLSKSKKHHRIDSYNSQQDDDESSVDDRNTNYAQLVDSYYDLATEFYEWGWGKCFHFSSQRKGETFLSATQRHEYYLAGRMTVNHGSLLLDCGCGVGGPARNIARFTGANIKAVTINNYQVNRGNVISRKEGIFGQVVLEQADFMKLPYADATFDGVYAIESTCHAPDRLGVYREILRVLKPGGTFACYEWCLTDKYDSSSELHRTLKKCIEVGDGLPDLVHTSVCTDALAKAGFEIQEVRDCALDGHLEGGRPWFFPLMPSWNPFSWPGFQFNPIMYRLMPIILRCFEFIGLVPSGTSSTQVMLQAGGVGCAQGGHTGIFTPMWLMVAKKPL